jgi:hypothetical protein
MVLLEEEDEPPWKRANVAFQQRGHGATIEFCTALPPNKHLQPTAASVACGSLVTSLLGDG